MHLQLFIKFVLECAFTFKMWFFFEMCFHFQNVKGFVSVVFPFWKNTIVNKNLETKICTVTTNSFTDEVVNEQRNIFKPFKFASVVKNLWFIIFNVMWVGWLLGLHGNFLERQNHQLMHCFISNLSKKLLDHQMMEQSSYHLIMLK